MQGLPTFFVLGAMKSGTTSLYRYLEQHPDLFFSDPKEPIFFEAQFERGLDFYRERYFAGWAGQLAVGEARSHHLFLPFVPARIQTHFPDARLVAVLRDPVERAYSHWWHRTTWGLETLSFRDALAANRERWSRGEFFTGDGAAERWRAGMLDDRTARIRHRLYLDLGQYAEQLERYRALFPAEQLKIVLFEDLAADPARVTRDVWEFVGLDPTRVVVDTTTHNPAGTRVRSPLAQRMLHMPGRDLARRVFPTALRDALRRYMAGRPASRPALSPEDEQALLEHYAPHNRALETLLGRALPSWFEPSEARRRASDADPADQDD